MPVEVALNIWGGVIQQAEQAHVTGGMTSQGVPIRRELGPNPMRRSHRLALVKCAGCGGTVAWPRITCSASCMLAVRRVRASHMRARASCHRAASRRRASEREAALEAADQAVAARLVWVRAVLARHLEIGAEHSGADRTE